MPSAGNVYRLEPDRVRESGGTPYACNEDLPNYIKARLPEYAQTIFRETFNKAFATHFHDAARSERSNEIAWDAVRRIDRRGVYALEMCG